MRWEDRYLLVVHSGGFRSGQKWGLPGGHVEHGEGGIETVRRELREELSVQLDEFELIGDFYYKRHNHRIYGAHLAEPIARFDRRELLKIAWFPLDSVKQLARDNNLHAGYEADAIAQFSTITLPPAQ